MSAVTLRDSGINTKMERLKTLKNSGSNSSKSKSNEKRKSGTASPIVFESAGTNSKSVLPSMKIDQIVT